MTLPEQIRISAAAGDFAGAARHFADHARQIRAAIESRACEASAIREAAELVEWVRKLALTRRSHLERRLQQIRSRAYLDAAYGRRAVREL